MCSSDATPPLGRPRSPRPLLCEQAGTKGAAGGTYNGCAVVTTNSEYIDGIQIWGVGIKDGAAMGGEGGWGTSPDNH